jgi:hypothetical protein
MRKLNCIVCDNPACRKVISDSLQHYILGQGKKRVLHYCSMRCLCDHYNSKKPIKVEVLGGVAYCDDPRVKIIDYDNEKVNHCIRNFYFP